MVTNQENNATIYHRATVHDVGQPGIGEFRPSG
jgi:hypothetical protein